MSVRGGASPDRIRRLLVANRGEIAVRVLRTCRRLGIEAVLTVTEADAEALPARLADRVVMVASYLDVDAVVAAARTCDALHPGYGFLSENPALAMACARAGVRFVGPSAATLAAAGDKLAARGHAVAAGVPVLPGGPADSADAARAIAAEIGFPLLVKAVGGGGGRGMRRVADVASLDAAVDEAGAEAGAAFADGRLYLERFVGAGRHVEVQLLGDGQRVVHLGDRDCSVQRRYQKLLEEAPAPHLEARLRADMHAAAVALGEHLGYRGAGTVEFLVHAGGFAFLEINARLQVEHPVTEAVTGLDLVAEQIALAEGRPLRMTQDDVTLIGHAIECRLNAEDPAHNFLPSPGIITDAAFPAGPGVRVDTHVQAGTAVTANYDSLLAKLIVHGAERAEALRMLRNALSRTTIDGVATTVGLHAAIAADPDFAAGGVPVGWLPHIISAEPARV